MGNLRRSDIEVGEKEAKVWRSALRRELGVWLDIVDADLSNLSSFADMLGPVAGHLKSIRSELRERYPSKEDSVYLEMVTVLWSLLDEFEGDGGTKNRLALWLDEAEMPLVQIAKTLNVEPASAKRMIARAKAPPKKYRKR